LKISCRDDAALPVTPGFGGGPVLEKILLPPLSPLPFDPEVQELETQVIQASNEVSELRASMQTALQSKLAAHLAECRPSGSVTVREGEADGRCEDEENDNALAALSPPPQELTRRLMSASGKVPELLARLEDAENRLQRILAATPGNVEELGQGC
jgi:hypothetical protein